jgi:hypothetical protein
MTQQTQNDRSVILPSLEAKLRQFAEALAPEEVTRLRETQKDDVTGMLSPSLRDKAQQVAGALSPEEQEQLYHLLERAGVAATVGGEADTQGYMKAMYEDDLGYKGKPGTDPTQQQTGGHDLLPLLVVGGLIAWHGIGAGSAASDP